jgi:hypothetical protein
MEPRAATAAFACGGFAMTTEMSNIEKEFRMMKGID